MSYWRTSNLLTRLVDVKAQSRDAQVLDRQGCPFRCLTLWFHKFFLLVTHVDPLNAWQRKEECSTGALHCQKAIYSRESQAANLHNKQAVWITQQTARDFCNNLIYFSFKSHTDGWREHSNGGDIELSLAGNESIEVFARNLESCTLVLWRSSDNGCSFTYNLAKHFRKQKARKGSNEPRRSGCNLCSKWQCVQFDPKTSLDR